MHLLHQHYGKAKIRVMKVSRAGAQHSLKELEVSVMLQGDFEASYTRADNSLVVPTDTMKNTVYVLAKDKLGAENEEFGLALGEHFLKTYPQVREVEVGLSERGWERLTPGGQPHPHAFIQNNPARSIATVKCCRAGHHIQSGIDDLLILKTTASGFAGYPKDRYTTLPETTDRIFATKLKATWAYARPPGSYTKSNSHILEAMLEVFAANFSPSVQVTLFQMGEAALKAAAEIATATLAMPNQHCLLVNLAPFGLENHNEVVVPTDEPHGQIEGTVSRDKDL
jgi:urate oxidase